jgi:hypothetical protein
LQCFGFQSSARGKHEGGREREEERREEGEEGGEGGKEARRERREKKGITTNQFRWNHQPQPGPLSSARGKNDK